MNRTYLLCLVFTIFAASCTRTVKKDVEPTPKVSKDRAAFINPGEVHFSGLRQLTFGGENAEAYFNGDGTELIFQSTRDDLGCDQIFRMTEHGENVRMVSTGLGRTTCGYLFPDGKNLIYSSSHGTLKTCPPRPDYSRGYVWPLLPDFDIYKAGADGEDPTPLAPHPGYDAEGVISPDGKRILFTSTRSGDIDIWSMAPDGTDLKQLTTEIGYDGGAFFSPDGSKIVWRAKYPKTEAETKDYKALLADNLVRPSVMNLYVMNADGTGKKKILENGFANFAPYFHPDGKRIVFASNMDAPDGRDFELYIINVDGTGLRRITYNDSFDAFPMFSHDGKKLVFASNRAGSKEGETNVFIADWIEPAIDAPAGSDPDAARWGELVRHLTAPEMGGRGVGTEGIENAAAFIETRFQGLGLEPGFNGSFRQPLDVVTSSKVSRKQLAIGGKKVSGAGFAPAPFSATAKLTFGSTFAGHGITAPSHKHDDYAGRTLTDRVVVVFRGAPKSLESKSGRAREADPIYKALMAHHRGARAVIIVNGKSDSDELPDIEAKSTVPIPVLNITWKAARGAFGDALEREWDRIESNSYDGPVDLESSVAIDVALKRVTEKTDNIVAKLSGKSDKYMVIGAHYDHLGDGGHSSLAPGTKAPHPGADDNASGVATMLEIARALKATGPLNHTVYFVAFTAEESGLIGSEHYVANTTELLSNAAAMFNFDMVGRPENRGLNIYGTRTANEFVAALRRANVGPDLELSMTADGFGPSDQTAFLSKGISVLHFFTGLHDDYHRPSDTREKLDPDGAAAIARLALRTIVLLDGTGVTYNKVERRHSSRSRSKRGYGPYFGSIPAFGKLKRPGVKVQGAKPGSPAEKAGLLADDIIVKFGEFDVTSMQDYAFAIRQHKPGDSVTVEIVRGGETKKLTATLGDSSKKTKSKK